jgi:hypothetical protein
LNEPSNTSTAVEFNHPYPEMLPIQTKCESPSELNTENVHVEAEHCLVELYDPKSLPGVWIPSIVLLGEVYDEAMESCSLKKILHHVVESMRIVPPTLW